MLPSPTLQADRLISIGVHEPTAVSDHAARRGRDDPPAAPRHRGTGLRAGPADDPGHATGFVVEDMTDVDSFTPPPSVLPPAPYVVSRPRPRRRARRTGAPGGCLPG